MAEAENASKRKYGCCQLGCVVVLIALVMAFFWPDSVSQTSPDGRIVAKMTCTSELQRELGISGTLSVEVIERSTGAHIYVTSFSVGDAWDNDFPRTIIWNPDSRRFAYILEQSETAGFKADTYIFDEYKHSVRRDTSEWLKAELTRRSGGHNQSERLEAEEILRGSNWP